MDLVGLKMVSGRQMNIYRDPVVKNVTNILTLQGTPLWRQAGTQFRTFFRKDGTTDGPLFPPKRLKLILAGFGIWVGTWRIYDQIGVRLRDSHIYGYESLGSGLGLAL